MSDCAMNLLRIVVHISILVLHSLKMQQYNKQALAVVLKPILENLRRRGKESGQTPFQFVSIALALCVCTCVCFSPKLAILRCRAVECILHNFMLYSDLSVCRCGL